MAHMLRVAVALGPGGAALAVQTALVEAGHEGRQALTVEHVLEDARSGMLDVIVVGPGLYHLGGTSWQALRATGLPLVLLADPGAATPFAGAAALLSPTAPPPAIVQTVQASAEGRAVPPPAPPVDTPAAPAAPDESGGLALAFAGPAGGGRTTTVLHLALALAHVAPVVVVDGDGSNPCHSALLGADPTKNLATLAHRDPGTPAAWDAALAQDGQPLAAGLPQGRLLAGVPQPEARAAVSAACMTRLITALRMTAPTVLLDVGTEVLAADAGLHRAALLAADDVVLVSRADDLGLWAARTALELWGRHLGLPKRQVALLVTAYDPRRHRQPQEAAATLGIRFAGALPEGRAALDAWVAGGPPVIYRRHDPLGHALLQLADRLAGRQIALPELAVPEPQRRWRRWRRGNGSARPQRQPAPAHS